jgi:transglutaminase-like putative cysteine protease
MAAQQEPIPRAHRLLALGAVGLLAAATAIAFGRVFVGHGATWKLLAAGLVSVAVAGLLERRSLLLATVASAVCLLVALAVLVFPQTTWVGLPTSETLAAIRAALGRVGEQARVQVAPTSPLAPLLLAAVTAVWTASFSAHALAIRAGAPLLAVLPSVALVGFTDTVMQDGARPGYAVVLLSAVLFVCFVDGIRRIRHWGPMWGSRGRRLSAATGHGARRVATLAVAVAVLVPGILPGFHSVALVDFSTTGGPDVRIDPFVSIKAQLQRRDPVDLFQVTSVDDSGDPRAAYWRLYALDEFDGLTWRSSDPDAERSRLLSTPATLAPSSSSGPAIDQGYRILTDIANRWLPMAYPPQTVDVPFGVIRYDTELTAAVAPDTFGDLSEGVEYSVRSLVVSPTPEELDAVSVAPSVLQGIGVPDRYTFVPDDVPLAVREIAEAWTENASTPYRQVLAIQQRFVSSGDFHYSLDVPPKADANALVDFLTKSRTGFCQQFAAAMAILVRELGIPARVAVGFRPGSQSGNTFTVSTEDMHSWVEVFFPGYGWLRFEPTPGGWRSPLATAGSYLSPETPGGCPPSQPGCAAGSETREGSGTTGGSLTGKLQQVELSIRDDGGRRRRGGFETAVPDTGYSIPYRLLFLALLALAALFLIAVPIVKAAWRSRTVRGARDPDALVLRAYRVFDGEAADLGLGRASGETIAEHRDRLTGTVRFSDGHLDRLTIAAIRAAYSERSTSGAEARDALRDARTAIRDIRSDAGLLRRLRGVYRPGL